MKSVNKIIIVFSVLLICLAGCKRDKQKSFAYPPAKDTGIDFENTLTETRDQNILDYLYFYNGGGVSIGDINNDGLPDIYFTGNQVKNKLYLNKGNLEFEDITEKAGVEGKSTWNTGVTMADVNGDGLLDIYVSAVVGVNGFMGHNELFINNGDLTFTEASAEYGLDLQTYAAQAAFFDMDNDGDLDVFILNHAVHTTESFGPANIRNNRVYESGDKLLLNENGKFVDISEVAGIYGGANSYGLGVSTADFNNDGFTDIYVGNDFHEDDYYYLNNGDGTFREALKSNFGHVSRFSMGNDAADINNDGFIDILTLDMLPEDEKVLKASAGEDDVNLHNLKINKLGYHPQYSRNMLQLNEGGEFFIETALMSGVAATDWSWGALFGDLDQDGYQDLFISNGIPKRPNDMDYVNFTSSEQIQKKLDQTTLVDREALELMPSGAVTNYIFKGGKNTVFTDMTANWFKNDSIISTGLAYGDLDNDGDLDLVTNNINSPASIYINNVAEGNFLKLKLTAAGKNTSGIGTKAILYTDDGPQYRQLYTSRGFQSSSEPLIHFGIAKGVKLDSLVIIWPDRSMKTVISPEVNSTLQLKPGPEDQIVNIHNLFFTDSKKWFKPAADNFGLDYVHTENEFNDFDLQKLIPHKISDLGPTVNVGDINGDGRQDVIFGGSRFSSTKIYLQEENGFVKVDFPALSMDSTAEDTGLSVGDFNLDGITDILIVSGGGESVGRDNKLKDRLYLGTPEGNYQKDMEFPEMYNNSSVVKAADFDGDGDPDIFIGSNAVNYNYGATPRSYLLENNAGKYSIVQPEVFEKLGMVNDAVWEDFDNDGDLDLIVVGEWMSPKFLENQNGSFVDVTDELLIDEDLNGLWQKIIPFDIDGDGDQDYLLGNWGLNTKLNASAEYPLIMYYKDFDNNGLTETVITSEKQGEYYVIHGLDELASQLNQMMRKRFTSYREFAGKTAEEVFLKEELAGASTLKVHTLASGFLENVNGRFHFREFDHRLQVAPIRTMLKHDFNADGKEEVLVGGNYSGVTPYHGKFDALGGLIIKNKDKVLNSSQIGINLSQKNVSDFSVIKIAGKSYLLVTINNARAELYEINF